MHFYQSKKSLVKAFIVGVLLITASFLIILAILRMFQGTAEAKTADAICRGSVALREKSYTEIDVKGVKVGSVATPLLCKTLDKYIPENKGATKEDIEREIAELMASCWERYGEGLIKDVFKEGDFAEKNCQVCYTVILGETSKFKGEITSAELLKFIFENSYKVSAKGDNCKVNGGFCIDSENRDDCIDQITADLSYLLIDKKNSACNKKGKKSCCYTDYECWNKGGKCSGTNPDTDLYAYYSKWECPSGMKCYAKKENYYSYGDYIQKFGGDGNIIITTNIAPGDTYAISFGSPNEQCGWCTKIGIATGIAAPIIAIAIGIPTGGVGTIGVLTISSLFVGGYAVGKGVTEELHDFGLLFKRDINTIYLTTLTQIQNGNYCSVVEDIQGS